MLLEIIGAILSMVGSWMIFKKMGRQGWEGIVPIYSTYVLCKCCTATVGSSCCC